MASEDEKRAEQTKQKKYILKTDYSNKSFLKALHRAIQIRE